MLRWLENAGNAIAGLVSGAGDWIKNAILAVFHFAAGVFDHVSGGWDWMVNGVTWFTSQLGGWAATVYNATAHILGTVIPDAVASAIGSAVKWAAHAISTVEHALTVALHAVERALSLALHRVEQWARGAIRDVWHALTAAANWIEKAGRQAADLVLHPDKLILWVLRHVTIPIIRLWIHAWLPIAVLIVRSSGPLITFLAREAESVLADLL